jgi:hypothetical protein
MKKNIILFITILILSTLASFFIYEHFNKELKARNNLSTTYTKLDKKNVYKIININKAIKLVKQGNGALLIGFKECIWCQQYVKVIDDIAKKNSLSTVYYLDIKEDRKNNTKKYQELVNLLKDKLKNDDLGNKRIFVPFLVIAKDKEILATNDETSTLSSDKVDPLKYWTKEKINALEEKLKPAIEKIKICNECNK